jgi:succinate-semialdehyde dehydrogenase/glutarate-semialdehyde dehydrogenase
VSGGGGEQIGVVSPLDGLPIGEVPKCVPDDVRLAVEVAREAQRAWAATPVAERCAVAQRFRDLALDEAEALLNLVHVENGKSRANAFEELLDIALTAGYYASHAPGILRGKFSPGALPVLTSTRVHHRPKGVVGVISPWNYPLILTASDCIPALLAGNAVVLKPDSQTPFCALAVLDLLLRAGLPQGVMQVVTGAGSELGTPLIEECDYIMFTGSSATGRRVAAQCADRLIGCSAELGGKNPMLVLADADLGRAVEGAVQACFSNTGQVCVSIERIYVHESEYEEFCARFAERVGRLVLGTGPGWDVDFGPLINAAQLEKVSGHVADAVAKGATVLVGGRARPDLGPTFYEPTVLTGVTEEMAVCREETFGPVVSVYPVPDDDTAVARANDTEYGLNASVWSRGPLHGRRVAARLRAGTVNVNEGFIAAFSSYGAPMGGFGISGLGRRHGPDGLVKYTEPQTVAVQRLMLIQRPPFVPGEAYQAVMQAAARVLRRSPLSILQSLLNKQRS